MTVAGCITFDDNDDRLVTETAGLSYEVEGRRSSSDRSESADRVWYFGYRQHLGRVFRYLRDVANNSDCHQSNPFHTVRTVMGGGFT